MKRSELPDSVFGIPEERKYPMPDKKHTLSAIKLFGHVDSKYEKELADNIIKNMKKYNISTDVVGDNNRLKKYIKESSLIDNEDSDDEFIISESLLSKIEEGVASTVEKDHVQKGQLKLSSFKKVQITESIINKYKKEYPFLKHVRCKDTDYYACDGYIWFDKDALVCMVGSCEYLDDKTKWIVSLEIMADYKGYGLSKQLLDFATKTLKCKCLSVNKKNKLAKSIYDKYGFKVYEESDTMYYMTIDKHVNESVGTGPVVGIGSPNQPEPIYIVNYMQNNVFTGSHQERFGICNSDMKNLHTFGGEYNRNHYTSLEDFEKEAKNIKLYRYIGNNNINISNIIENADTDIDYYTLLTGNNISSRSDIEKDSNFVEEVYISSELSAIRECIEATIMNDSKGLLENCKSINESVKELLSTGSLPSSYIIPMVNLNEDGRVYNFYRDLNGVFVRNELTGMRSKSYYNHEDIRESVIDLISKGTWI